MPRGQDPNSRAALVPFKRGHDPRRNVQGRPPIGASVVEWLNVLGFEDPETHEPAYSLAEVKAITEAAPGNREHSIPKRLAARWLTEAGLTGKRGRESLIALLARSLGHPRVSIEFDNTETKKLIVLDGDQWNELLAEHRAAESLENEHAPALPG
jgi:hypothetical protein